MIEYISISEINFFPAYAEKLKSRLKYGAPVQLKQAGVYFIKENGIITYIGMSGHCVVKACYRHFQRWRDHRVYANRITYVDSLHVNKYEVGILYTKKKTKAEHFEKMFIIEHNPRDNRWKYLRYFPEFEKSWALPKIIKDILPTTELIEANGYDDLPF